VHATAKVLTSVIALSAAGYAHAQLFESPLPPERKFNDRGIIECVRKGVEPLHPMFARLLPQSHELRRNNQSIASLITEHRRLEERWCEVEARCASAATSQNIDFVYGETFSLCIAALPRKAP
jgi:hypothetical protein